MPGEREAIYEASAGCLDKWGSFLAKLSLHCKRVFHRQVRSRRSLQ